MAEKQPEKTEKFWQEKPVDKRTRKEELTLTASYLCLRAVNK